MEVVYSDKDPNGVIDPEEDDQSDDDGAELFVLDLGGGGRGRKGIP